MLELRNICKIYNPGTVQEICLFENFNLSVPEGQFVSVVGSNGSGKTSMLNIICGSIAPDSGSIILADKDIVRESEHRRARRMGRVYQNPAMGTCASMTILENMALADNKGKRYDLRPGTDRRRVEAYKELLRPLGLGLENMMNSKVGSLSGGQRQALSLIMSSMTPIEFLILDEHTAALDPATAEKVLEITKNTVEENRLTCMMITHNMQSALELGNRTIMMNAGKIILDVTGEERAHMTVADLLDRFKQAAGKALDNDRMLLSEAE